MLDIGRPHRIQAPWRIKDDDESRTRRTTMGPYPNTSWRTELSFNPECRIEVLRAVPKLRVAFKLLMRLGPVTLHSRSISHS
jgi:hypothetical protein